ncbi:flagellar basal body rod protein FlgB [Halalkalibacterium ligniniphilum]|uniref:flagellar basal body rod protein FlgB n=1 Tax=Halalkalibacterium ligniniphilum TaxID=1134413 RepID=UPI000348376B|nr:flagellar basal body rod protein FlgB [Halalkalibacterium ligniniphilum]
MNLFAGASFSALERGLDASSLRQKVISQNIANVDTPNYKAKQVNFKHVFNDALERQRLHAKRTDERHYEFGRSHQQPYVESVRNTMYNHNNNNVDIDLEMAELAQNQIYYNALIDRVNGRFNSLQSVIRGGR